MKMVKKILYILLCVAPLCAKDVRVRSSSALQKKLSSAPYSIVLFYDKSRDAMRDKTAKQKLIDIETMFRSLSNDDYYKDAQLQFIRADVARKGLVSSSRDYNLIRLPAFVIFLGRQLTDKLYGYAFRQTVEKFIAQNLKIKMDKAIKQADEQRKKNLEQAKINNLNRPYWYGPYGYGGFYPYWWYGPGWPYYRGFYW